MNSLEKYDNPKTTAGRFVISILPGVPIVSAVNLYQRTDQIVNLDKVLPSKATDYLLKAALPASLDVAKIISAALAIAAAQSESPQGMWAYSIGSALCALGVFFSLRNLEIASDELIFEK